MASSTAANSSQVSDGAAVLVADREAALSDGLKPRARFLARVAVGDDPVLQLAGVIPATVKALKRAGLSINDIDWFEVNEAFASVVLGWARELKPKMEKVNPWGGAIAHGIRSAPPAQGCWPRCSSAWKRPGAVSACKRCALGTAWPRPRLSSDCKVSRLYSRSPTIRRIWLDQYSAFSRRVRPALFTFSLFTGTNEQ